MKQISVELFEEKRNQTTKFRLVCEEAKREDT